VFDQVPIVFITRFADPANEKRAFDVGAADFIAKPYTPAVLLARLRNLLDLRRGDDLGPAGSGEGPASGAPSASRLR
jgi:DNA-binding response OmpR family regulator